MEQPPGVDGGFGTLLRRLRGIAGLTQEELAAAAGLGVRTLRDLELGVSARPQRRTAERLATALRLGPAERTSLIEQARTARLIVSASHRTGGPSTAPASSLPREPPDFIGRAEYTQALLDAEPGDLAVVNGPPGAGKSTLLIHAAHLLASGHATVVYAEPAGIAPHLLLGHLLTALGVEPGRIPEDHGPRLAAYQRLTSSRRGVLVLDNVLTEQEVWPLLPAGSGWRTLISSRSSLTGLPATRRITLGPLPEDEALLLLAAAIGPARVAREPGAAAELATLCGLLPLALRVVANRLSSRPGWTLRSLAERLQDPHRRLDRLSAGDLNVRTSIETSYQRLPPPARSALHLMSMLPESTCDSAELLALAGPGAEPAVLDALHDSGLLLPADVGVPGRYRLHLLTALYCAAQTDSPETAAQGR